MKEMMKDMKKILFVLLVALVALPTMAQNFKEQDQQVFRSTSTLTPSGSQYSAQPMLNEDGTAYNPAASSGPRRAKAEETPSTPTTPTTPDVTDPEKITPVGDAVWPLMLMALAYLGVRVFFRRKRA